MALIDKTPSQRIAVQDINIDIVQQLHSMQPKAYLNHFRQHELVSVSNDHREVRFWLYGRGEFYGFIILKSEGLFSSQDTRALKDDIIYVLHYLAEETFAHRVNVMCEPMGALNATDHAALSPDEIAKLVTRCFGADGSTLRLVEHDGVLKVAARDGQSNARIIAERLPGELVSGKVLASPEYDWAAVVCDDPAYSFGGLPVATEDRKTLRAAGIYALVTCGLFGRESSEKKKVGTLSYYFLRPTYFSRRDISLFQAFARRVSDRIILDKAFGELHAKSAMLESQGQRMIYVEVANLLAHDLWHKSQGVLGAARESLKSIENARKNDKLRGSTFTLNELQAKSRELLESATSLYKTHNTLRSVQTSSGRDLYEVTTFLLADVVKHVHDTLTPALDAQKISVIKNISPSISIGGPQFIFEQVIFNLFINTIDAAKMRPKTRPMNIEMSAHVRNGRLIFRFTDDGPGIDAHAFPDEQAVFEIGRSNKKDGTGTGLPIARQIIGTHFKGNLTLSGRRPPLFTIDIPVG